MRLSHFVDPSAVGDVSSEALRWLQVSRLVAERTRQAARAIKQAGVLPATAAGHQRSPSPTAQLEP